MPFVRECEWNSLIHHTYRRFLLLRASVFISFLPSFVLLVALAIGRSVFLLRGFAVRFFLLLSSSGESHEIQRIKNHEYTYHGLVSRKASQSLADDLIRGFEFHLNNVQIKRHYTRTKRRPEIYDEIKKKGKREIWRQDTRLSDKRETDVSCRASPASRRIPQLWCDRHRASLASPEWWRGLNHARWPFDIFTTGDEVW